MSRHDGIAIAMQILIFVSIASISKLAIIIIEPTANMSGGGKNWTGRLVNLLTGGFKQPSEAKVCLAARILSIRLLSLSCFTAEKPISNSLSFETRLDDDDEQSTLQVARKWLELSWPKLHRHNVEKKRNWKHSTFVRSITLPFWLARKR